MSVLKIIFFSLFVFLSACGGSSSTEAPEPGTTDNNTDDNSTAVGDNDLTDGSQGLEEGTNDKVDPVNDTRYTISGMYAVYYSEDDHDSDKPG